MQHLSHFIANEIELIYRSGVNAENSVKITTAMDAFNVFRSSWNPDKMDLLEQGKMLLLDKANQVLGLVEISSGGVAGTIIDLRHVFAPALKANASSIVLAHNHPSGNLTPSSYDYAITERLQQAGDLLDIPLLDHLIITRQNFRSILSEATSSRLVPKLAF